MINRDLEFLMDHIPPNTMKRLERAAVKWWIDFPGDPRVDPMEGDTYLGWTDTHKKAFMGGIQAYHAILMERAPEFDEREIVNYCDSAGVLLALKARVQAIELCRWQHLQMSAQVEALHMGLEDRIRTHERYLLENIRLREENERLVKENSGWKTTCDVTVRERGQREDIFVAERANLRRALDHARKKILRLANNKYYQKFMDDNLKLEKGEG